MAHYTIDRLHVNERELYYAICDDNIDKVKTIFKINDEYDTFSRNREILRAVLKYEKYEMLNYFIMAMKDHYIDQYYEDMIFMQLFSNGYIKDMDLECMLSHIKNINIQDDGSKRTILHGVIHNLIQENIHPEKTYMDAIKIFIEYGADPFIEDVDSRSAIDLAIYACNSPELLEILLKSNIKKYFSIYEIYIATGINTDRDYDIIEVMLQYVENINEPLDGGHSLLHEVKTSPVVWHKINIIELLEACGAKTF